MLGPILAACGAAHGSGFDVSNGGPGGSSGEGDGGLFGPSDGSFQQDTGSGDIGGQSCATGHAGATRQPVYLLFVLDGSGSMSHDDKWVAVTGALDAIFTEMQTSNDPGVGAGLIVFSDSKDPNLNTGGGYPSAIDIPVASIDQAQLAKLIGRTAAPDLPQSNTPTGRALAGGYGELAAFQPASPLLPGGKKVLVLMTDGVPTDHDCKTINHDGTDDYTQNACVKMAAAQLATVGAGGSIETFVVGVGPLPGDFQTYDPYFLAALAVAGGSAPAGCDPKANANGASGFCYFNVDPTGSTAAATQQAFQAALDVIRGQVSTCTLAITATDAGAIDPGKVNVVLNGSTISQDPVNGWTFDNPQDPTAITLHGTACDTLKNDGSATISIVLGCKTQVPK